ncbi:MAG TPA: hypothetical protein VK841_10115 [Polyangiaceae bacterium]|nr:hypothetical protein [Polyangiaceae bacterium]
MTDAKLCGHPWGMLTRSAVAVVACAMLGCSGRTAETSREPDASDAAPIANNVLSIDASTDVLTAWDASAGDGAVLVVPLDSGSFETCLQPASAPSDACAVCETLDIASMTASGTHLACNVEGLQCGVGCTVVCRCNDATWICAPAPPCR